MKVKLTGDNWGDKKGQIFDVEVLKIKLPDQSIWMVGSECSGFDIVPIEENKIEQAPASLLSAIGAKPSKIQIDFNSSEVQNDLHHPVI